MSVQSSSFAPDSTLRRAAAHRRRRLSVARATRRRSLSPPPTGLVVTVDRHNCEHTGPRSGGDGRGDVLAQGLAVAEPRRRAVSHRIYRPGCVSISPSSRQTRPHRRERQGARAPPARVKLSTTRKGLRRCVCIIFRRTAQVREAYDANASGPRRALQRRSDLWNRWMETSGSGHVASRRLCHSKR